ncbi:MAG TPA: hypothetical protein VFE21_01480 [Rubrobacteraceae bacterium]|nr:hypothetical protein [Rubrobacteraceae bacterium]
MFWRKGGRATPQEKPESDREARYGPIQIKPDAERPATILQVAAELERRGAEVVELFKEIETDTGRAVFPIHLRWQEQDFFVEIETRRWRESTVEKAMDSAAVLRRSDYAEAGLGLLSAYPAPERVAFFFGKTPAALFQINLYGGGAETPSELADEFIQTALRQWDTTLDYSQDSLPLVEELLTASLKDAPGPDWPHEEPPILGILVESLGCYLGEVVLRNSSIRGAWIPAKDWGESFVLELDEFVLDPIGKARAFLDNGADDSIAYYADYVLRELGTAGSSPKGQDQV